MRLINIVCCFCSVLSSVCAFNIFPKYAQVFSNNVPDSYFGYSVLLQAAAGNNPARVVIGSPRSNTTYDHIVGLKSLVEPGAVYSCPLTGGQPCKQFLFDTKGNVQSKTDSRQVYISKRDHSFLGGSIDGLDVASGRLVACSPRWMNQFHRDIYFLQNGLCYLLEDSTYEDKIGKMLLPLINHVDQGFYRTNESVYYYALGEAGMSVHLAKNNTELLFGAPGVLQWKGMIGKYFNDISDRNLNVPNPHQINAIQDFAYFGYAVSSGKFKKDSNEVWYVGGAPRGRNLMGQVLVFDYGTRRDELKIYYEMFGHQEGEYFGAAVSVGDVNGDGADDVIVASPMYSTPNHYDVGCVHVYINNLGTKRNFESTMITPPSPTHGIRFGTAVSVIGDINKDGYSDLAIGSPYYNNGQGAIFIYLGSSTGISEQYSQKILASDIAPTLRGFGSSFSRGVDVDNNKYNDFAVGSYISSQAVVLKTRPVVTVRPVLKSDKSQISIKIESFKISGCITYTGQDLPSTLKVKILITADDFYKRVQFSKNKGTMLEIVKDYKYNVEVCDEFDINVVNSHSDFTQPIGFKMYYELVEPNTDAFCATCPVVDKRLLNYTTLSISYETGCGSDNICRPNLKLDARFNYDRNYLVIGERERLDVSVDIRNFGDPAFACKFYAEIPLDSAFVKIPDTCQYVKDNVLLCDMGNPVKQKEVKSLLLPLDVSGLGNNDHLVVKLNVTSGGAEADPSDNNVTLRIPLKTEVRISVIGISNPEQFNFIDDDKLKQDNWTFNHEWTVQNLGPSPLNDLELTFWIPQSFGPDESNVVEVYKPEASADGTSIECRSESREGFYVDPTDAPTIIEADPDSRNLTLALKARRTRSSPRSDIPPADDTSSAEDMTLPLDNPTVYTRVQKLIASDREIPEGLQENRTFSLGCGEDSDLLCMKVVCNVGVLKRNSRAMVNFRLLADLKILDQKREEKDTIVITSSVQPESQYFNVNKTYTHTLLTGNVRQESPLKWIILGLIFGIILLCLIIYGLYRAGFFRRKDHEKLMNEKEGDETFGELTEQTD